MSVGAVARVAEIEQMMVALRGGPVAAAPATAASATAAPTSFQAQLAAAGGPAPAVSPTAIAPAGGPAESRYDALIQAAAARHGLDPALLKGLIRAESNFDPTAGSPAGAQGLTQLMPATAASLGVTNVHDPAQAIEGGAKYLAQQLKTFDGDVTLALAAYNAGPGAVQRYGGVPPYAETQAYVGRVQSYADGYRGQLGASAMPGAASTAPLALAATGFAPAAGSTASTMPLALAATGFTAPTAATAPAVSASPTAGASIL